MTTILTGLNYSYLKDILNEEDEFRFITDEEYEYVCLSSEWFYFENGVCKSKIETIKMIDVKTGETTKEPMILPKSLPIGKKFKHYFNN